MPAKRSTNFKKRPPRPASRKTPSYAGLKPASLSASMVKSRNRSADTKAELELRKALSSLGLRYRLHVAQLPGRPDVVFSGARVVFFAAANFGQGRTGRPRRSRLRLGTNARYWIDKIKYNIARDKRLTCELETGGWAVVRLWETDILRDPVGSAKSVSPLGRRRLAHRLR